MEKPEPNVNSMAPNVDSIRMTTQWLLEKSLNANEYMQDQHQANQLEAEAGYYLEELTLILLNWMTASNMELVRDLLSALEDTLIERMPDGSMAAKLPLKDRLASRIKALCNLMIIFLRSENLAQYIGFLAGPKRESYLKVLYVLYDANRPMRFRDIRDKADLANPSYVLKKMVNKKLLIKEDHAGMSATVYSLTLTGRNVTFALMNLHEQDPIEEVPIEEVPIEAACFTMPTRMGYDKTKQRIPRMDLCNHDLSIRRRMKTQYIEDSYA